jgi:hypothetical protein
MKNNPCFLKFNQTNNNANEIVKFIKQSYKAKMLTQCGKNIDNENTNDFIKNNIRMSAIEFI